MRGPTGTPVGQLRRIQISNVVAYDVEPRFASIISGIPGHYIEDVKLSNIRIFYQGGGTAEQGALSPPEKETSYPEPSMFGTLPAYGFFIRHVKGIELNGVTVSYLKEDARAAFVLNDVDSVDFVNVTSQIAKSSFRFNLQNVSNFRVIHSKGVADTQLDRVEQKKF